MVKNLCSFDKGWTVVSVVFRIYTH